MVVWGPYLSIKREKNEKLNTKPRRGKMVNSHHFNVMIKIQVTVLHPTHPEMIGEDYIGIEMDFFSS